MSAYREIKDSAGLDRCHEADWRELFGAAERARFSKDATCSPHLAIKVTAQSCFAFFSQAPGSFFDDGAVELRHARGRSARPR